MKGRWRVASVQCNNPQAFRLPLFLLAGGQKKRFYILQLDARGQRKKRGVSLIEQCEKKPAMVWGSDGLHAGCQLPFHLSVTICWGASRCSEKCGLSPKASSAAEETLRVAQDHSATRERGEREDSGEKGGGKEDKMKEKATVTASDKRRGA